MCLFPGVCSQTAPNLNSGLLAPPDPRAPRVKTASLDWILFSSDRFVWRLDSTMKGLEKSLFRGVEHHKSRWNGDEEINIRREGVAGE